MTFLETLIAQANALQRAGEPVPLDLEARIAAEGVAINPINDHEDYEANG